MNAGRRTARFEAHAFFPRNHVADAGLRPGGGDDDGFAEVARGGEQRGEAGGVDAVVVGEEELHPRRLAERARREKEEV